MEFTGQGKKADPQLDLRHYIELSAKEEALAQRL
jgi:hypothetical protein